METTRHFMLEWLSYTCRYIPVGLLDVIPQRINWRLPSYYGRNDLETLMASDSAADWVSSSPHLRHKLWLQCIYLFGYDSTYVECCRLGSLRCCWERFQKASVLHQNTSPMHMTELRMANPQDEKMSAIITVRRWFWPFLFWGSHWDYFVVLKCMPASRSLALIILIVFYGILRMSFSKE